MKIKAAVPALIAFWAFVLLPTAVQAIPAFGRKYGFSCTMCHTAFPKLNDFGQRFRDNGYQIPGQQGREPRVIETAPPIALRTTPGFSLFDSDGGTTSGFNLFGFDVFAGGVLHRNISFLVVYTPRLDLPSADFSGDRNASNPSQAGTLETASIVFSNLVPRALNLRVGRFEPAYHAFSARRTYYVFEPYEVYGFTTPGNTFVFGQNQMGAEATGHFRSGFKYGLGVVNGTGGNPDNNTYKDVYLNLFQTFGKGEGQSAGQRVGALVYYGWQPSVLPGAVVAPTGETHGSVNRPFYRWGLDASLNWKTLNARGLFLRGVDHRVFNTIQPTEDYRFTGGFAELDWAALADNRLVASALYNWVRPPSYDAGREINAYSALLRYYLGDWTSVNVALHAEYTFRRIGETNPLDDNLFAFAVDFDL